MKPSYIPQLYTFLDNLSRHNDRQWFAQHKAEYQQLRTLWLADVDRMIALMAQWDPRLSALEASRCAYRIYRDTRFSHDKTPYKLHFAVALSPIGRRDVGAGYYLQTGHDPTPGQGLYAGIWCPDSNMLRKLRHAIVDNIDEFTDIIQEPGLRREFPTWCGDTLKTIPKGWDRNHPQAELLRRLDYGRMHPVDDDFFLNPDWPEHAAEIFHTAAPLVEFINYSLFEE